MTEQERDESYYQMLLADGDAFLHDSTIRFNLRGRAFKRWLHAWEIANLPVVRNLTFSPSKYANDVTLVIYCFGTSRNWFGPCEFSILHTWRMLGQLRVNIITDRETPELLAFKDKHAPFVTVTISSLLADGQGTAPLSQDCLCNLHRYFSTPYCLTIQDDGFPIRDNLNEFLGKWDYIGAPNVGFGFKRHLADLLLKNGMNGGFSLRSRRYCLAVTRNWEIWLKHYVKWTGIASEDQIFACTARLNPWMRLRYHIPWTDEARRFSFDDIVGEFDAGKIKTLPLGLHRQTTIWQMRKILTEFGYDLSSTAFR